MHFIKLCTISKAKEEDFAAQFVDP
jgi:hypothetical protein